LRVTPRDLPDLRVPVFAISLYSDFSLKQEMPLSQRRFLADVFFSTHPKDNVDAST
jgi:hypothetical protein